jgi:ribosomal protein S18 acetylase RimI-like enzyme
MNIVIRAATAEDADFLAHGNAAMALETEHKQLDPVVVGAGVRAALADSGKGLYFIAESNGRRVGQLMFTYEWSDWRNGTFWWIQSVYVLPEARRNGVFLALFRHVEHLAERDPGVCGIRLYVERENTRAQATYRRCGLHDAGYTVMEVDYTAAAHGTDTGENDHAG